MISIEKCNKLLDSGFSLITASANKKPNMRTWKAYQTTPITKQEFQKAYNSIDTLAPTEIVGLLTGFNNLEGIDVDLKVFPTLQEQEAFWKELYNYIKDNIDDFDKKFSIYKTKNQGYHILYKCEVIEGNKKIATLKGHTAAVIESRGKGGYVVIYDNKISQKDYLNISTISPKDREILWTICRTYNYVNETELIQPDKKVTKEFPSQDITTWQDYNNRHSIWDVIHDDFKIVRKMSKHTIILRHGATSAQSGYVYTDSGRMFLFSTGTIYPNEKLINPFAAYTYKYHNGNFTESARDLYSKGYGSRKVKPIPQEKIQTVIPKDDLVFPIDIFPPPIQTYMIECKDTLHSSIDYMGCSMLWCISLIIGNSIRLRVSNGWEESACIWVALVGKPGIGKTPSINNVIKPLKSVNNREIKAYIKAYEKWQTFEKLSKEEQKQVEDVSKPKKSQFIVDDITLEALVDMHEQSKNAIGVFKDELNGWIKDMNKYREGSDLEFWLSTWSGNSVSVNRITRAGSYIEKPHIPVLGGIQPAVLNNIYTDENKDNGFIDRLLLSYPELEVGYYNRKELSMEALDWFTNNLIAFFDHMKKWFLVLKDDGEIDPYYSKWTDEAHDEYERIFNRLTDFQRADDENEYMKSMYPKIKSYVPRFSLLLHVLDCYVNSSPESEYLLISKESVLKAERLMKYFIAMAKKTKMNTMEIKEMKYIANNKQMSTKEKLFEMLKNNPEMNRTEASSVLSISRQMVQRYIKEFNNINVEK